MTRNNKYGIFKVYLGGAVGVFALTAMPAVANAFADLSLHDVATDAAIAQPVAEATTEFPSASKVVLKVQPANGAVVDG